MHGYAGSILRVDLSSGKTWTTPTEEHAGRFLGGRGLAAKLYFDEVSPETGACDPGNTIVIATGPLCGVPAIGGSRWTICGKSPLNETFSYCNLGGTFGAELKFAGYDALGVTGAADEPCFLLIEDNRVEIREAGRLKGMGTVETRDMLKDELGKAFRVLTIGPAGENRAVMASFFAENDASGSGQLAAAVGAKNLKAVAVRGTSRKAGIGRPDDFKKLTDFYRGLDIAFPAKGWQQISRWSRDLVKGFRFVDLEKMKKLPCYGCLGQCARQSYRAENGTRGKFLCHSAYFYQPQAERFYGEWNDVPFYATRLCDDYGLDTKAVDKVMNLLDQGQRGWIFTDSNTGLPLSKIGSLEFIESLVKKISFREGIGDALARGVDAAKKELVPAGKKIPGPGILDEPAFFDPYGPRYIIMNAFPYAMEPTFPIGQLHEASMILARWQAWTLGLSYLTTDMVKEIARRFWGGEAAADFTTYDGKARAAMLMQNRQYAKESLVLCDFLWPVTQLENTDDHAGDPSLESRFLSAVLDKDISEGELAETGERIFNLQRAVRVREGRGGRELDVLDERCFTEPLEYDLSNPECLVPGNGGEPVSRKGEVVDRRKWEEMKDEYYSLRGWDPASGLQTEATLLRLGLPEVGSDLSKRGLVR